MSTLHESPMKYNQTTFPRSPEVGNIHVPRRIMDISTTLSPRTTTTLNNHHVYSNQHIPLPEETIQPHTTKATASDIQIAKETALAVTTASHAALSLATQDELLTEYTSIQGKLATTHAKIHELEDRLNSSRTIISSLHSKLIDISGPLLAKQKSNQFVLYSTRTRRLENLYALFQLANTNTHSIFQTETDLSIEILKILRHDVYTLRYTVENAHVEYIRGPIIDATMDIPILKYCTDAAHNDCQIALSNLNSNLFQNEFSTLHTILEKSINHYHDAILLSTAPYRVTLLQIESDLARLRASKSAAEKEYQEVDKIYQAAKETDSEARNLATTKADNDAIQTTSEITKLMEEVEELEEAAKKRGENMEKAVQQAINAIMNDLVATKKAEYTPKLDAIQSEYAAKVRDVIEDGFVSMRMEETRIEASMSADRSEILQILEEKVSHAREEVNKLNVEFMRKSMQIEEAKSKLILSATTLAPQRLILTAPIPSPAQVSELLTIRLAVIEAWERIKSRSWNGMLSSEEINARIQFLAMVVAAAPYSQNMHARFQREYERLNRRLSFQSLSNALSEGTSAALISSNKVHEVDNISSLPFSPQRIRADTKVKSPLNSLDQNYSNFSVRESPRANISNLQALSLRVNEEATQAHNAAMEVNALVDAYCKK